MLCLSVNAFSAQPSAAPNAMLYSQFSSLVVLADGDAAELVVNSSVIFEASIIPSAGEAAELVATELVASSSALFNASTAAASDQLCIPVFMTS